MTAPDHHPAPLPLRRPYQAQHRPFRRTTPEEAMEQDLLESQSCDLILVIGTSATIHPVASLPVIARERSVFLIEINPEQTLTYADLRLPKKLAKP